MPNDVPQKVTAPVIKGAILAGMGRSQ